MNAKSIECLATELREQCGHDSRSVDGCVPCEAADRLENQIAAMKSLVWADEEYDAADDGMTTGGVKLSERMRRMGSAQDARARALSVANSYLAKDPA